jgi:hypothetical protein
MAASIVGLIGSLAPDIINLIASLVQKSATQAEQQLGSGTGPVKFAQVFTDVITALQNAASAGAIGKTLPGDDDVKLIIQSVVTSMKNLGLLSSSTAATLLQPVAAPAGTQTLNLHSGDSLTITVS